MQLRMWMYDLAREQAPTLDHLRDLLRTTQEAGYNAFGLYMEHRFAYPSTPWAHGTGCVTPEMIRTLCTESSGRTQIIPFINLLGHFEGMIYTEQGKRFRESLFQGMQACPSNPEFISLCEKLIDETVKIFDSEIIHIGGDETWQLGLCDACKARVEREDALGKDGKAALYGSHFGPLAHRVVQKGRRPAVWGDMFLEHPGALDFLPKETLIFDWQYFGGCTETSRKFRERGFDVVCCPTIHAYNSVWCHLPQSEQNVADAAASAQEVGAYGVCVTTWECGLMGNYGTILPAIKAIGGMLEESLDLLTTTQESCDLPNSFDLSDLQLKEALREKRIRFKPTTQLPDLENDDDASLSVGIILDILLNALQRGTKVIDFSITSDQAEIYYDGSKTGYLPVDMFPYVARRFRLHANIDPLKISGPQSGVATLQIDGDEFPFVVEIDASLTPSIFRLTRIATTGSSVSTPTPTLPRQGGGSHHSADYFTLTDAPYFLAAYTDAGEQEGEWARLMGVELPKVGGVFGFSKTRSSLKVRLLLNANPFLCWMHHHEELCGPKGDEALAILEKAIHTAPNPSMRGVSEFVKLAIEFVRFADQARQAYAQGLPGVAASSLAPCRQIFEHLEKVARATNVNWGGSLADIERCRVAREHVERVIKRVRDYGDGSLGYLPAFEHLTHPKFVPHDQAAWWLINRWANE